MGALIDKSPVGDGLRELIARHGVERVTATSLSVLEFPWLWVNNRRELETLTNALEKDHG